MKNKIIYLLIVILLVLVGIKIYTKYDIIETKNEINKNLIEEEKYSFNIYVYDSNLKEIIEKEVYTNSAKLQIIDIISKVIENSDYLSENMKLLSVYNNIREKSNTILLIKVSKSFSNLNDFYLDMFSKTINQSIYKYFNGIDNIYIQIDTNK